MKQNAADRTLLKYAVMSAFDPKRTSVNFPMSYTANVH
jgi:hypothetical protein